MLAHPGEIMAGEARFYSLGGEWATPGAEDVLPAAANRL